MFYNINRIFTWVFLYVNIVIIIISYISYFLSYKCKSAIYITQQICLIKMFDYIIVYESRCPVSLLFNLPSKFGLILIVDNLIEHFFF